MTIQCKIGIIHLDTRMTVNSGMALLNTITNDNDNEFFI